MTLLPELIDKHRRRDHTGKFEADTTLEAVRAALEAAGEFAEQAAHAVTTIRADKSRTPAANEMRIKATVTRLAESAAKALDAAHSKAAGELQKITRDTSPPQPVDAMALAVAGEIRRHLVGLDDAARDRILGQADDRVIAAVVAAPAFVSGMSDNGQALALTTWRRKRHPEAVEREQRVSKAPEAVQRAGRSLPSFFDELLTPEGEKAAAAAKKADAAVAAATPAE
jgi:hypothetical protein